MAPKKQPLELKSALDNLAHDLGITRRLREYNVITLWAQIVGDQIARVATARRVENRVLFVEVSSAPWRAELSMRRQEIMEKINRAVGRHVIREIRFR